MIGLLHLMWAEANRRVLEDLGYRPPASMNPRNHDPFGTWVVRDIPRRQRKARELYPRSAHFWDMFACFERGLELNAAHMRQFGYRDPLIWYKPGITLGDTMPALAGSVTPPADIPAGDDVVRVTMVATQPR